MRGQIPEWAGIVHLFERYNGSEKWHARTWVVMGEDKELPAGRGKKLEKIGLIKSAAEFFLVLVS